MSRIVKYEAVARVLVMLGINPEERTGTWDQDTEYTACRSEELPQYFELYRRPEISDDEKRILACFMIESLNDFARSVNHELHDVVLNALFDNEALHKDELDYWVETDDPDEKNWWPIRKGILRVRKSREGGSEK